MAENIAWKVKFCRAGDNPVKEADVELEHLNNVYGAHAHTYTTRAHIPDLMYCVFTIFAGEFNFSI